jgi:hypothetical protein
MASQIRLNGEPVETVFDLLGRKENDITYALGWGLAQAPPLMKAFLELAGAPTLGFEDAEVDLQLHRVEDSGSAITDIEITTPATKVIVEAKRGWGLPSSEQLAKYTPRLARDTTPDRRLVVLTQWGEEEYVRHHLGDALDGHPIATVGLAKIAEAGRRLARLERQVRLRQLLDELARYLLSVAEMGNPHDNRVYVVSLSTEISEAGVSYIEVVESLGLYWYPAGGRGGWPKTPFNYMGFRYRGELQGIRHVERSRLVAELADAVPNVSSPSWGPAFVLALGAPIPIPAGIRTGAQIVRSARRVIDVDLLLTSATISEAYAKTRARHAEFEA